MRFKYCPNCGSPCTERPIGDEGLIPYCDHCNRPWFEIFSTCVLSVVIGKDGRRLLIRQSYGDTARYVGIAGYMKCGETAEQAAVREIAEETGIAASRAQFLFSAWHASREQLMLCFAAFAEDDALTLSGEVAEGKWFTQAEAEAAVRPGSIIEQLVLSLKNL